MFEIPKKYKPGNLNFEIWKSNSFFFHNIKDSRFEHIEDADFEFMEREEVLDKLHSFIDSILLNKSIKKYAVVK